MKSYIESKLNHITNLLTQSYNIYNELVDTNQHKEYLKYILNLEQEQLLYHNLLQQL